MAVALKYSGEAVLEAMQALEQAGIPTESATVIGFGDDPAIRELLQVVHALSGESDSDPEGAVTVEDPDLTDELQTALAGMDHLGEAVRRWASESGLKERVATDTAPLGPDLGTSAARSTEAASDDGQVASTQRGSF